MEPGPKDDDKKYVWYLDWKLLAVIMYVVFLLSPIVARGSAIHACLDTAKEVFVSGFDRIRKLTALN